MLPQPPVFEAKSVGGQIEESAVVEPKAKSELIPTNGQGSGTDNADEAYAKTFKRAPANTQDIQQTNDYDSDEDASSEEEETVEDLRRHIQSYDSDRISLPETLKRIAKSLGGLKVSRGDCDEFTSYIRDPELSSLAVARKIWEWALGQCSLEDEDEEKDKDIEILSIRGAPIKDIKADFIEWYNQRSMGGLDPGIALQEYRDYMGLADLLPAESSYILENLGLWPPPGNNDRTVGRSNVGRVHQGTPVSREHQKSSSKTGSHGAVGGFVQSSRTSDSDHTSPSPEEGESDSLWGLPLPTKKARQIARRLKLPEEWCRRYIRSSTPARVRRNKRRRMSVRIPPPPPPPPPPTQKEKVALGGPTRRQAPRPEHNDVQSQPKESVIMECIEQETPEREQNYEDGDNNGTRFESVDQHVARAWQMYADRIELQMPGLQSVIDILRLRLFRQNALRIRGVWHKEIVCFAAHDLLQELDSYIQIHAVKHPLNSKDREAMFMLRQVAVNPNATTIAALKGSLHSDEDENLQPGSDTNTLQGDPPEQKRLTRSNHPSPDLESPRYSPSLSDSPSPPRESRISSSGLSTSPSTRPSSLASEPKSSTPDTKNPAFRAKRRGLVRDSLEPEPKSPTTNTQNPAFRAMRQQHVREYVALGTPRKQKDRRPTRAPLSERNVGNSVRSMGRYQDPFKCGYVDQESDKENIVNAQQSSSARYRAQESGQSQQADETAGEIYKPQALKRKLDKLNIVVETPRDYEDPARCKRRKQETNLQNNTLVEAPLDYRESVRRRNQRQEANLDKNDHCAPQ